MQVLCLEVPLQQQVTRRAGPFHIHPIVPAPSTALPSLCTGSLPTISPSSRACTHSSNREVTEVQHGAEMYTKTSLGSKA